MVSLTEPPCAAAPAANLKAGPARIAAGADGGGARRVEVVAINGDTVASLLVSEGTLVRMLQQSIEETSGTPIDQQKLLFGDAHLMKNDNVFNLLPANTPVTLVKVPSIEDEGLRLMQKHGWKSCGKSETSGNDNSWLIAHYGYVFDSTMGQLGEVDFRAMLRHIPRCNKETGFYVYREPEPLLPYKQDVIEWQAIFDQWDDHAIRVELSAAGSGMALWDAWLQKNDYKEGDYWM